MKDEGRQKPSEALLHPSAFILHPSGDPLANARGTDSPRQSLKHSSSPTPLCAAQYFGRFSARLTPPAPRLPEIRAVTHRLKFLLSWTLAIALLALPFGRTPGQGRAAATPSPRAWTLEGALASLALQ